MEPIVQYVWSGFQTVFLLGLAYQAGRQVTRLDNIEKVLDRILNGQGE